MKKLLVYLILVFCALAVAQERFDFKVRRYFFAGYTGDDAALDKGMKICDEVLAADPKNAEALVWHGSGVYYRASQAFQRVTHFFANDKLTYAATPAKNYVADFTIQQLEERLDPDQLICIHRSTIVALKNVHELHAWFAGKMKVRLNDERRTQLNVARERVKALKEKLGLTG